ncbi:hypothetical protein Q6346_03875 [Isoptericola sp. b490]|uniref:hypothetical protein n=1 Tax=Actinotalea lenta TaxID=3064654 RepID=UPI0027137A16|nr:hypothetical protein [Isoptericola sp. b490]MDO8120450.1 hypothetical protein [Isoptericola sp. b490]
MSVDARLHVNPTGALLDAARDCELQVFSEWYGNTAAEFADEYGPYDDASVFLALEDAAGDVVAVMRLIAPVGTAGLKALNDIGHEPWGVDGPRAARAAGLDLASTWEIATLGSRRQQGSARIRNSLALYHGFGVLARVNAMSAFVAILDERVRRLLDMTGLRTHPLPGTRTAPYLGSDASTPVYGVNARLADQQRREHPDAFALVAMGSGLDGIDVPPDDAFRLFGRDRVAATSWITPDVVGRAASSPLVRVGQESRR